MNSGRERSVLPGVDRVRLVFFACLVLVTVTVNVSLGDATAPRITAETIVRYLQQDLFVSPGIGFKKVRVGYSFDRVGKTWGLPNKRSGSVSKTKNDSAADDKVEWTYIAGSESEIILRGNSKVKEIEIQGSLNSPFSSTEGAVFGMTPHQVISIYGPPTNKGNLNHILYASTGIAFGFELGALRTIRIFKAGASPTSSSTQQSIK